MVKVSLELCGGVQSVSAGTCGGVVTGGWGPVPEGVWVWSQFVQ